MKIYAGNLSYDVTEDDLREAFEAFGEVESASVIMDKYSGRSKGFGFVEMPSDADAKSAIDGLNETELQGRTMTVNEARPRTENRRGGGGGRGEAVAAEAVVVAAEAADEIDDTDPYEGRERTGATVQFSLLSTHLKSYVRCLRQHFGNSQNLVYPTTFWKCFYSCSFAVNLGKLFFGRFLPIQTITSHVSQISFLAS